MTKPTTVFERFGITDLQSAEKAIRKAWIAGSIFAWYLLVLSMLAMNNIRFILNEHFSASSMFHAVLVGGLSYGIYRKSRVSAILFESLVILAYSYAWYKSGTNL